MLIDFTVENFRSFKDARRFSLLASPSRELPENLHVLPDLDLSLVRTAAIYGPNASGKSNLLAAMHGLSELLETPINQPFTYVNSLAPFALDRSSASQPTRFTVRFVAEGVLYQFEAAICPGMVLEERLTAYPSGRAQEWYNRHEGRFRFNKIYLKGQKQSLQEMTSPGKLFLAVAATFDHPQLSIPARWLATNFRDRLIFDERSDRFFRHGLFPGRLTARLLSEDTLFKDWVNAFLGHADLAIQTVGVDVIETKFRRPSSYKGDESSKVEETHADAVRVYYEPYFMHSGEDGITVRFGRQQESLGTRRLFDMLGPFYEILKNGQLALIDEFGSSIHPSMARELVRLFHNPKLNPRGAQLIFATHDTTLLTHKLFRRDQIWFTEKSPTGATDLYSLHDIKGVREDEAFDKGYLRGRYGAIPFFGAFDFPEITQEVPRPGDAKRDHPARAVPRKAKGRSDRR